MNAETPNPVTKYRLALSEKASRTAHWQIKGLYLSPVCLLLHLAPLEPMQDGRKDALRALLRRFGQRAMEHDLWRPVAGLIEGESHAEWASEQDWHRGDFLLFFADEKPIEDKLLDLLDPGPGLPALKEERAEPRSPGWFRSELDRRIDGQPADRQAGYRTLLDRILPQPLDAAALRPLNRDAMKGALQQWAKPITERADRVSRGEAP